MSTAKSTLCSVRTTQFHHVIDIAPTILEAAGVQMPAVLNGVPQKPIGGVSMAYSFDDAKAASAHLQSRGHRFESVAGTRT
jgi:arylsulfatase A-like enzyme